MRAVHIEEDTLLSEPTEVSRTSVISRASIILDAFRSGPERWLLSDLTDYTGLPRSTVFRLITQLVAVGWLERDAERQGYRLGRRMIAVGQRYNNQGRLREAAHPVLEELHKVSGLFVHLSVLEDAGTIHYLDKVGNVPGVEFPSRVGFRYPLELTSSGKAMLAAMPNHARDVLLEEREEALQADLTWLREELPKIRRNFGVATLHGGRKWVRMRSAGAPIMGPDGPVGGVSLGGFDVATDPLVPLVLTASRKISATLFPDWHREMRGRQQRHIA